jgi:hypothetical protein
VPMNHKLVSYTVPLILVGCVSSAVCQPPGALVSPRPDSLGQEIPPKQPALFADVLAIANNNVARSDSAVSATSSGGADISAATNGKKSTGKKTETPVVGGLHFFGECDCGSTGELDKAVRVHSEHDYRMDQKFLATYYYEGRLPSGFSYARKPDIERYLSTFGVVKPALLYYSYNETNNRFCAWLVIGGPESKIVSHVTSIGKPRFTSLPPRLRRALGVQGKIGGRIPLRRNVAPIEQESEKTESLNTVVGEVSGLLFPDTIAEALLQNEINSLIVVPITSFGTVPFSLLTIRGRPIVEFMSVFVAPALNAFLHNEPSRRKREFSHPIVFGDPGEYKNSEWIFPALPGARSEALAIARMLSTSALIGRDATFSNLKKQLSQRNDVSLIYLATHGMADFANPLDGSVLLFADGLYSARKISELRLSQSHPLVVLSACQTGLGKDFDVGTIGLARAFYRAGASTVLMSLWSVNDQSTEYIMTQFMNFAREYPVDIALRLAMNRTRESYPNPIDWAGFSLYGAPTLD